jgi:NAD-dependent deacetylase
LAEKTSTLSYYLNDPEVRKVAWEGRVRNFNGTAQPNDGHHALVHMQRAGKLSAVITQNVDGLHQDSGIEPVNVVEVHGTIKFGRCWECKDRRPMKYFIERVIAGEETWEPAVTHEHADTLFSDAGLIGLILRGKLTTIESPQILRLTH